MCSSNSFSIYLFVVLTVVGFLSTAEYGNFTVDIIRYEVKVSESLKSYIIVNIEHKQFDNGSFTLSVYANVKKHLGAIGLKLRQFTWNDQQSKYLPTVNFAVNNICEKQFAKELINMIRGIEKNCSVRPGVYNFTIADLNSFLHIATSGKFFYGKYLTLTDVFAGKNGRILRSNVTAVFRPAV